MDIRIAVVFLPDVLSEKINDTTKEKIGSLHMYHCNIISGYSVRFCTDSMENKVVSADKLTASDPAKLEFSLRISNCLTLVLRAMNHFEYQQFAEALSLSKEIINMRLQLNMCLRECFFDGVYANADIPENISFSNSNFDTFLTSASASVLETIAKNTISMPTTQRSTSSFKDKSTTVATGRLNYSNMMCVYCDTPGNFEQLSLQVHPYVPVTMDRKVLYLCIPCRRNWLSYRQTAAAYQQLVLPGEFNEEVCCVCSDSPPQLVLCSSCPRSYCTPCLLKLLTQKQSDDMATNENWQCLCCVHSEQAFRGFTSTLRMTISSQTCPLPLNRLLTDSTPVSAPAPALASDSNSNNSNSSNSSTVLTSTLPGGIRKSGLTSQTQTNSLTPSLSSSSKHSKRQRRSPKKADDHIITLNEGGEEEEEEEEVGKEDNMNSKRSRPNTNKNKSDNNEKKIRRDSHTSKSINSAKKKSEEKTVVPSLASTPSSVGMGVEENLPPVNTDLDEVHYFSRYIKDEEDNDNSVTEDSCFLCKDGGDLIECDHGHKGATKSNCVVGCRKVYHEYCLGYAIPDEQKVWLCVRHFCAICGTLDVMYQCQTCPLSCCHTCFLAWNEKNNFSEFAEVSNASPPDSTVQAASAGSKVTAKQRKSVRNHRKKVTPRAGAGSGAEGTCTTITCGTCLRMYSRCFERKLLSPESCNMGCVRKVSELRGGECPLPSSLLGNSVVSE